MYAAMQSYKLILTMYALSCVFTHTCICHTLFRLSMTALEASSRSTTSMWLFCTATWRAPSSWNCTCTISNIILIYTPCKCKLHLNLISQSVHVRLLFPEKICWNTSLMTRETIKQCFSSRSFSKMPFLNSISAPGHFQKCHFCWTPLSLMYTHYTLAANFTAMSYSAFKIWKCTILQKQFNQGLESFFTCSH